MVSYRWFNGLAACKNDRGSQTNNDTFHQAFIKMPWLFNKKQGLYAIDFVIAVIHLAADQGISKNWDTQKLINAVSHFLNVCSLMITRRQSFI